MACCEYSAASLRATSSSSLSFRVAFKIIDDDLYDFCIFQNTKWLLVIFIGYFLSFFLIKRDQIVISIAVAKENSEHLPAI